METVSTERPVVGPPQGSMVPVVRPNPICIASYRDLPGPVLGSQRTELGYLRSKIDPRAMLAPFTGAVYVREDGEKWEHAAYRAIRDTGNEKVTVVSATAYADAARYLPGIDS